MDLPGQLGNVVAYRFILGGDGLHGSYFGWTVSLGVGVCVYSVWYCVVVKDALTFASSITSRTI